MYFYHKEKVFLSQAMRKHRLSNPIPVPIRKKNHLPFKQVVSFWTSVLTIFETKPTLIAVRHFQSLNTE